MTIKLRFACDGHRHSQPCRGALNAHTTDVVDAYTEAFNGGWRQWHRTRQPPLLLCHSAHHDEEENVT